MFVCVALCKLVVKLVMRSVDDNATLLMFINFVNILHITWIPSLACAQMSHGGCKTFQQSHKMTVWYTVCNKHPCHTDLILLANIPVGWVLFQMARTLALYQCSYYHSYMHNEHSISHLSTTMGCDYYLDYICHSVRGDSTDGKSVWK